MATGSDGLARWAELKAVKGADIIDCGGRLITPGLIDCHTHLVYGGDRADEFELRLEGASYEEIANSGGGILSTVKATREASESELLAQARPRLEQLLSEGVTTVEIKSGYGLDAESEMKMLRVAKIIGEGCKLRVQKTFLAAHALPLEYSGRADDYIQQVCEHMLPRAHTEGLVDAVDVFIESIAFSVSQAERVFDAASTLGLPIKAHVEQLERSGRCDNGSAGRGALFGRSYRIPASRGCAEFVRKRQRRGFITGRFLCVARDTAAPARSTSPAPGTNRNSQRRKPGQFTGQLPAVDHEYGLHNVWHDSDRGIARCYHKHGESPRPGIQNWFAASGQTGRPGDLGCRQAGKPVVIR